MEFKLVSKNNMGVVATLILVILLSQSKFFNFLIDNALGRLFLIFFIILISFVNKILGVVAVLFIIIMFNQSSMGFYEGFTNPTANHQNSLDKLKKNASARATPITTKKPPSTGIEGFNTVDREGVILRGKRSSEMPFLFNTRNQSENVKPTNTSIFANTYSSF